MAGFVWGFPSARMLLYNVLVHMQGAMPIGVESVRKCQLLRLSYQTSTKSCFLVVTKQSQIRKLEKLIAFA